MIAHTPGPWHVKAGQSCQHVVSEDGYFSTGCISFDGQSDANARLIATAPELLAACREVDAFVAIDEKDGSDGLWTDDYRALVEIVRAAIAKAEGR